MTLRRIQGVAANHYEVDHFDDLTLNGVTNLFRTGDPNRRWAAHHVGPAWPAT